MSLTLLIFGGMWKALEFWDRKLLDDVSRDNGLFWQYLGRQWY